LGKLEIINNNIEKLFSKTVISIAIICIVSFTVRIYFTNFELPLESQDAFHYLIQAMDIQKEGIVWIKLAPNYGWQSLLSFFIFLDPSKELIEYMNLVRILAMIFSVATIPIVYKIGKSFLDKKFAILASAFFSFDPNLIENSIFGITEALFIFLSVLAIYFGLKNNVKFVFLSAIFAGLALDVRVSGVIVFIFLMIIFLTKKNNFSKIKTIIIFLTVFCIASFPFFLHTYETTGNPLSFIEGYTKAALTEIPPSSGVNLQNANIFEKFENSIVEIVKHTIRISIPYLFIFVPIGLIYFFKDFFYEKKAIILLILINLLIAIPQYMMSITFRNLFLILPFFSLIGAYGIQKLTLKQNLKNIYVIAIIILILIASIIMLNERKQTDIELVLEKEKFGAIVTNSFEGIFFAFKYYPSISHNISEISTYYDNGKIGNLNIGLYYTHPSETIFELMQWCKEKNIDYIVIDDTYDARIPELIQVYLNEKNYSYLEKVFDTKNNDFEKINVKIFKINYDKLE
jgi:Gpi18-like mannosyltransferase